MPPLLSRRRALTAAAGAAAAALPLPPLARAADDEAPEDHDDVLRALQALLFGFSTDIPDALAYLRARGRPDVVSGLIFALRFTRYPRDEILDLLEHLAGAAPGRAWPDWMLWLEGRPDLRSHPAYRVFKRTWFMTIDPDWRPFLRPEFIAEGAMDIRFEEVVWGGVHRDTIPSLDDPALIPAAEAAYLRDDDLVFGVRINGDARAYPLRIMGWHEMFNDVIGGVPVALAYCTLCGAGILYDADGYGRAAPFRFATSGFLHRSNKLMYDRRTESLWTQFEGRPVSGPLRGSGLVLRRRPVVIEPWGAWRARHPRTQVLSLRTGHERDYGSGVVYRDYFASPDLMFPARVDQSRLRAKDHVFAIRRQGAAKAWALDLFADGALRNDVVGGLPIVLIGDGAQAGAGAGAGGEVEAGAGIGAGIGQGRGVRAYERGDRVFARNEDGGLVAAGQGWTLTEDALVSDAGRRLPRIAGHLAYWFAWNNHLGPEGRLVSR